MTNRSTSLTRIRSAAALRADAHLLTGDRSRVAVAASGTSSPAPEPETGLSVDEQRQWSDLTSRL